MSTDDLHRIRRQLRQIVEDGLATDYKAEHIELQGLMQETVKQWKFFTGYMNMIHGKSALFTTSQPAAKILLHFLIDRRQQLQGVMQEHQDEFIDIDVPEEVKERIMETRALLQKVRELKALTFIVADIDNGFQLTPIQGDDESKKQLHSNTWAQQSMRQLAAKGVPFQMAA